jgi:ATP-dependent helicase/nuclease subunit A
MNSPPDQAERNRIAADLDRNILVEASAGTGKTTCLVTRMINLLGEGKCTIDGLAAVTYTRKAASELRDRFQVELERQSRHACGAFRERFNAALEHVERAYLGTIHAFCARLLRERPVEAGVDAVFRELNEADDYRLRRQAWDEHMVDLATRGDPVVSELAGLGIEVGQLRSAFFKLADYADVPEWPAPLIVAPDPTSSIPALTEYVQHMVKVAATFPREFGNDKLMPQYQRIPRMVRQADRNRWADWIEILEEFEELKTNHLVQKNWPEKGQGKEELERWNRFAREHALTVVDAWRRARYSPALKGIRPALARYDQLRHEAGSLSFQDLLLKAAALLRAHPSIRQYFRERYSHLLVDEFQDTDPIQAEVMLLLTSDNPQETDWRRSRPVPGSLFVVGDPKQSIYRFRRADIVTYGQVKSIIEKSGGLVSSLTASFRSTPSLLQWLNPIFDTFFPEPASEVAPANRRLMPAAAADSPADLKGVYCLSLPGGKAEEARSHEAPLVAGIIQQALANSRTIPRPARSETSIQPSPCRPADFLIITPKRKNLSTYAWHLEALCVPHEVTGGSGLNESEELRLLYLCLRAAARPHDPVDLLAALRSPVFGISDQALYDFKRAGGQFHYRRPVPESGLDDDDHVAFEDAFRRLARFDRWMKALPIVAALEKVASDLGLYARAAAQPGGHLQAGGLSKAVELARTAQRGSSSAMELLEYLAVLVDPTGRDDRHDGISVQPHKTDTVRIMNLHQAKGLEAPVVFLADPSTDWQPEPEVYIDRSGPVSRGYLAISEPYSGYKPGRLLAHPEDWPDLSEREKRFQDAERTRLLYVAATRAGSCLTITERQEDNRANPWRPFEPYLHDQHPQSIPAGPRPAESTARTVGLDEVHLAVDSIAERWRKVRGATYNVEAMKKLSLEGSPAAPAAPVEIGARAIGGADWGTVIHLLLEAAMNRPRADLRQLARSFLRDLDAGLSWLEDALEMVGTVQKSQIWKRAVSSKRRFTELPMQFLQSNGGDVPVIERGTIDLVFLEPAGWVIVDYKTDQHAPGALTGLTEHYRPQVERYANAWRKLIAEPVQEVGLLFTRSNSYVRL